MSNYKNCMKNIEVRVHKPNKSVIKKFWEFGQQLLWTSEQPFRIHHPEGCSPAVWGFHRFRFELRLLRAVCPQKTVLRTDLGCFSTQEFSSFLSWFGGGGKGELLCWEQNAFCKCWLSGKWSPASFLTIGTCLVSRESTDLVKAAELYHFWGE